MGKMTEIVQHHACFQYHSYLLRLWMEDAQSTFSWRIALVNPNTGERWGFTDPAQLAAFLTELAHEPQSPEQKNLEK